MIEAIHPPEEFVSLICEIVDRTREYARKRGYGLIFSPVPNSDYFCAYRSGASGRGAGKAIVCFENKSDGLSLVFHDNVMDLRGFTSRTKRDEEEGCKRILINRSFEVEELEYIMKMVTRCVDKMMA